MQKPIRLGPLALLLAVISVCLTTMAVLTVSTAQADRRLAEKYAQQVQEQYQRETAGQEFLAALDTVLSTGADPAEIPDAAVNGTVVEKNITVGNATLEIRAALDGQGGYEIIRWKTTTEWNSEMDLGDLWGG